MKLPAAFVLLLVLPVVILADHIGLFRGRRQIKGQRVAEPEGESLHHEDDFTNRKLGRWAPQPAPKGGGMSSPTDDDDDNHHHRFWEWFDFNFNYLEVLNRTYATLPPKQMDGKQMDGGMKRQL